jgi:DNA modification methylase
MNLKGSKSESTTGVLRLAVVYRLISELKRNPKNPRTHIRKQIDQLARSVETFGFIVPVIVDSEDIVVAGHGRILACQRLGWTEVPTIRIEHLTREQLQAFTIADNKLTDNSTWDDKLLAEQLKSLSELELDFDVEVTGFEMGEIDLLVEGLGNCLGDKADQLPTETAGPPVTNVGDLWLLGRHRVYCGDALEKSAYITLTANQKVAAAITDPPFNVAIAGNVAGLGKHKHREFLMASGEMNQAQFIAFLNTVCSFLVGTSREGSLHYIFMDWRHIGELLAATRDLYGELKNLCVWVKDRGGMGSFYRSQHELVFVFKQGGERHRNNVQLGQFGRNRTNVWSYPSAASFSRNGDEGNLLALHPTVKPVAMIADAIMDCTARNEVVLDPFLGSGTTVIAAERTGRRCFGIEIDPLYVDVIVRRWQNFTRDDVTHAATGLTFNQMTKGRDGQDVK